MSDAFRAAYMGLIEAARAGDAYRFANHVRESYELATHASMAERERAVEAIGPVIADAGVLPGAAADLAIVAGALVETGAHPKAVGLLVLRQLVVNTSIAVSFVEAWEQTGQDPIIEPEYVTTSDEERVARVLGAQAGRATMAWWTSRRFAAAGVSMLSAPAVRAEVAAEPELYEQLLAGAQRLATPLPEFAQMVTLLGRVEPRAQAATSGVPPSRGPAKDPPAPGALEREALEAPGAHLVPAPPASAAVRARWGLSWRPQGRAT